MSQLSVARSLLRDVHRTSGLAGVRVIGRRWLRYGDYLTAERLLRAMPSVALADLTTVAGVVPASEMFDEQAPWSMGVVERVALQALVRPGMRVLELGTFDGGTTRVLAEAVGPAGHVTTVDLPDEALARFALPVGHAPADVGRRHRDSPVADRVTQLRCDTRDLTPADLGTFDLVLVDAAHDHDAGLRDARLALAVCPDGLVVFDDFVAHWGGLVRGIVEACQGRDLRRLQGTSLGVVLHDHAARVVDPVQQG